jgi:hypothetical protein
MTTFNFNKPTTSTQGTTGLSMGQSVSTANFGQGTTFGGNLGTNKPTTNPLSGGLGGMSGMSGIGGIGGQGGSSTQTGGMTFQTHQIPNQIGTNIGGGGFGTTGLSTGQSTGLNFGGSQSTIQTGMFNKPPTSTTGASTAMPFTKTDTNLTTGLGGFSQQPMGLGTQTTSNIGGGFSSFGPTQQSYSTTTQQPNKKELDRWEIVNVIQNYINCISPSTNMNVFKAMLYNRVPKGYENNIHSFQNYPQKIKSEDGTDISVDYNLWVKALQNNPVPQIYYPYQISSPSHLVQRTKTTEVLELTALETILNLQNNLNDLNNLYDNEIESEVSGIKKKLHLIKNKQLYVISKMERLALLTDKVERNYSLENSLNNKLSNLKNVLTETNDYTIKIKELSSMSNLIGYELTSSEDKDYLKEFDNDRFEKNVNILRDLKKIVDVTFNNLKQNMSVVNFIKNDLENLKRYGKIPK